MTYCSRAFTAARVTDVSGDCRQRNQPPSSAYGRKSFKTCIIIRRVPGCSAVVVSGNCTGMGGGTAGGTSGSPSAIIHDLSKRKIAVSVSRARQVRYALYGRLQTLLCFPSSVGLDLFPRLKNRNGGGGARRRQQPGPTIPISCNVELSILFAEASADAPVAGEISDPALTHSDSVAA